MRFVAWISTAPLKEGVVGPVIFQGSGLVAAVAASRLIRQLLFGVSPLNIWIYAGVAALFVVVATLACLGPSWRASRISPLVALREG
jgi:ABC-type antimicrobial peptide transport system permease subunit